MPEQTFKLTLPNTIVAQIESEVSSGAYKTAEELVTDVLQGYLEDRKIERLVIEGLRDDDITPLEKMDFVRMKQDLIAKFGASPN